MSSEATSILLPAEPIGRLSSSSSSAPGTLMNSNHAHGNVNEEEEWASKPTSLILRSKVIDELAQDAVELIFSDAQQLDILHHQVRARHSNSAHELRKRPDA